MPAAALFYTIIKLYRQGGVGWGIVTVYAIIMIYISSVADNVQCIVTRGVAFLYFCICIFMVVV